MLNCWLTHQNSEHVIRWQTESLMPPERVVSLFILGKHVLHMSLSVLHSRYLSQFHKSVSREYDLIWLTPFKISLEVSATSFSSLRWQCRTYGLPEIPALAPSQLKSAHIWLGDRWNFYVWLCFVLSPWPSIKSVISVAFRLHVLPYLILFLIWYIWQNRASPRFIC